jgi:putative nucleotidyltransferase with HDIG domain
MRRKFVLDGEKSFWAKWKDHNSVRIVLYAILGVTLYLLMMGNIAPEVVDVSVGSKADRLITSPITITDDIATEREQGKAAREVDPVYVKDDAITMNQVRNLDHTFSQIKEVISSEHIEDGVKIGRLQGIIPYELSEESYNVFLAYPIEEIETMRRITTSIVHEIMNAGVRQQNDGLKNAFQRVTDSLILSSLDSNMRMVSREMAKASIIPNYVYNQEDTDRLRQEAKDNVAKVVIREGEVLVTEGDIISSETYRKLHVVGLLSESANLRPYLGLGLLIMLLLAFIGFYISFSGLAIATNNTRLLMYVMIVILNVAVMKVTSIGQTLDYVGIGFIAPIAFATMLITMLLDQRIAIFSSFLFGIIAAILLNGDSSNHVDFTQGLVTMFSGAAGAFFLGKATRKTKILQAGFVVSAVTVIAIFTVTMLNNMPVGWLELSKMLLFGLSSGLIASVLTIGLMPFFEAAFNILSPMKLIELSNPNQPLLRKVLIEAPGTYHHSVMVANLAEAATEAVGGNGLLARVGAYYHDVGKTKRPHFFIENQMNMGNPHDKIAPQLSKTIITAHARDGAQMLREYTLPKAIHDIAEQHHGTTLLKYFYHKAKQESDSDIVESDFRYPGPKAQFKESAIVGIADCVEAAVRSLSKPSPERIENMVRNIIRDRLEDGQFDECDLTLKELNQIAKAICETLHGIFHSRIEYPEDKEKSTGKQAKQAKQARQAKQVQTQQVQTQQAQNQQVKSKQKDPKQEFIEQKVENQ